MGFLRFASGIAQLVLGVAILGAAFTVAPSACDGSPSTIQHMGAFMGLLSAVSLLSGAFLLDTL